MKKEGRWLAGAVSMPAPLLGAEKRYMKALRARAIDVSMALKNAGIPHAVSGGLAVATHVAAVDAAAVRNTHDMNILLRREDLERTCDVLKRLGFMYRKVRGVSGFLEQGKSFKEAIDIVFAGEKVRDDDLFPAPKLRETVASPYGFECVCLEDLVIMNLTRFKLEDKVDIQDFLASGMITKKVRSALPHELQARLTKVEVETEHAKEENPNKN